MSDVRNDVSLPPGYYRRDRWVGWACNQILRLASPRYRAMIGGSVRYGLEAAMKNRARANIKTNVTYEDYEAYYE